MSNKIETEETIKSIKDFNVLQEKALEWFNSALISMSDLAELRKEIWFAKQKLKQNNKVFEKIKTINKNLDHHLMDYNYFDEI